MNRIAKILAEEGLFPVGKTASAPDDFRDLEIVLEALGDVKFFRASPGSGSVQATIVQREGVEVALTGKMEGGELTFDAAVARKLRNRKLDIPYEDHYEATHELRQILGI